MSFDPSEIDVPDFLEVLEVRNLTQATTEEMRFSCPYPNHMGGDESPSCYMNTESSAFFCHSCKEKGTGVDLASYMLSISPLETVRMLRQRYSKSGINPDSRDMVEEVQKILNPENNEIVQPVLPEEFLKRYEVNWPEAFMAWDTPGWASFEPCDYMFERGFEPEWLEDWEFGYDFRTDRITFAVRDISGKLVGFKARATRPDQKPKYLVLGNGPNGGPYDFARYYTSQLVYGAHRVPKGSHTIICEGELNAVATHEKTGFQAVAINGSHFSDFHAKTIIKIADSVTLFLDQDKPGLEAVWGWEDAKGKYHPGIVDRLKDYMEVKIAPQHLKDAADMAPDEVKACLEDAQSYVFSLL